MHRGSALSFPLVVEGLNFAYKNDEWLFKDFVLHINSSVSVLEGYSGCGKTTLLKLLAGLLRPSSNNGRVIFEHPLLVLQEDALLPWLTGEANVRYMVGEESLSDGRVGKLKVAVKSFLSRSVYQMSFGQRRLVELYRALISNAETLLLDEPFNYLDERNAHLVWRCLLEEADQGRLVILSTHHHGRFVAGTNAEVLRFEGLPPWRRLKRVINAGTAAP